MNTASEAIIRWLLSKNSDDTDEIDRFVEALRDGVAENDTAAHAILDGALVRAYHESRSDPDCESIEKLIRLHFELKGLDDAEKTVEILREIRNIVDLPPVSGPLARVRSWGVASQLKRLGDRPD